MSTLTARAVLEIWEQTVALPRVQRTLQLWSCLSGQATENAHDATIGECDRGLIAIYRNLFGRKIAGRADCPQCLEMLELDVDLEMFDVTKPAQTVKCLRLDDIVVEWRFPTASELADLAQSTTETQDAREALLKRCVEAVRQGDRQLEFEAWPSSLASELGNAMTTADPLLDPRIGLVCAACEHAWSVSFDIATFLWNEINDLARQLLSDVHLLAAAYGWNEREILELSAARRAAYLQMCGG